MRKPCSVSHQRIEQAVGMAALQVALDALGAKHPAVEGKLLPRLEAGHAVVADLELNAALLAAEAAVGLDQLLGLRAGFLLPAARRRVVQVRTEAAGQFVRRGAAVLAT